MHWSKPHFCLSGCYLHYSGYQKLTLRWLWLKIVRLSKWIRQRLRRRVDCQRHESHYDVTSDTSFLKTVSGVTSDQKCSVTIFVFNGYYKRISESRCLPTNCPNQSNPIFDSAERFIPRELLYLSLLSDKSCLVRWHHLITGGHSTLVFNSLVRSFDFHDKQYEPSATVTMGINFIQSFDYSTMRTSFALGR